MTLRPDMSDISICDDKYIIFALPALINSIQKHQLPYPHVKWSLRTHLTLGGSFVIEFMDCRLLIDFTDPWKVLRLGENVKMFCHTCFCLTAPDLHIHLTERLSCCQAGHQLQAPDLYLCHTVTVLICPPDNKQDSEKRKTKTRTQM